MRAALFAVALAACSSKPESLSAGRYDLDVHISVKPKHWIRSEPDLVVVLADAGDQVDSCRIESSSSGHCVLGGYLERPYDLELIAVDRKGYARLPDGAETNRVLAMTTTGEIRSADVRITTGHPWLMLRVLGAAGGVVLALGTMAGFRKQLYPAPPPLPRCTHCGKRIAEAALRCDHCGAAQ